MSKAKWIIAGTVTYISAVGAGYMYSSYNKAKAEQAGKANVPIQLVDSDRKNIYSKHAPKYDQEIGTDEMFMGMNLLRWYYIGQAKGKVTLYIIMDSYSPSTKSGSLGARDWMWNWTKLRILFEERC